MQVLTTSIGTPDTERLRAEAFLQRERAKKKLPDLEAYNGDIRKLQGFKSLMKHKDKDRRARL